MKNYLAAIVIICCLGNSTSFYPNPFPVGTWHANRHDFLDQINLCRENHWNLGHSAAGRGFYHEIRGHVEAGRRLYSMAYRTRDDHPCAFVLNGVQRRGERLKNPCHLHRMAMQSGNSALPALEGSDSSPIYESKRTRRRRRAPPSENELWTKALESQTGPVEVLLDLDNAASALEHIEVGYACTIVCMHVCLASTVRGTLFLIMNRASHEVHHTFSYRTSKRRNNNCSLCE
jgi:hypothetical protein